MPNAKFREVPVGTVAPRGLRGNSLLPGQGAPEQIEPDDIELAVLRDAETLDGANLRPVVPRPAPRPSIATRSSEPRAPSPTPVSVEVPRVRSMPPQAGDRVSSPPTPSARSIQSGTLMSIGSVDPRAPTELSLPTPRPLSVSERAAYLGPEAVVDRTPPRDLPEVTDSSRARDITERPGAPISEPAYSSQRNRMPSSSARPSHAPDSLPPPAQHFARTPLTYGPDSPRSVPSTSVRPGSLPPSSRASTPHVAPQYQVHADLDAVRRDPREDAFDLRSAATQREPLAGRRAQSSSDWTPHAPPASQGPRSSNAALGLVDGPRDTAPPTSERIAPARATVPLSFVVGAALFALVLALLVAMIMRPNAPQATRPSEGRATAAAPESTVPVPPEPSQVSRPTPVVNGPSTPSAPSAAPRVPKAAPHAASSAAAPAPAAAEPIDSNSKSRTIY